MFLIISKSFRRFCYPQEAHKYVRLDPAIAEARSTPTKLEKRVIVFPSQGGPRGLLLSFSKTCDCTPPGRVPQEPANLFSHTPTHFSLPPTSWLILTPRPPTPPYPTLIIRARSVATLIRSKVLKFLKITMEVAIRPRVVTNIFKTLYL